MQRFLVILLSFFIAGCTLPVPSLSLDAQPRQIAQVTVTNSAGQTVMQGQPNSAGLLTANPAVEQLDGKLTIVWDSAAGERSSQEILHDPKRRLLLIYSPALKRFEVEVLSAAGTDGAPERPLETSFRGSMG